MWRLSFLVISPILRPQSALTGVSHIRYKTEADVVRVSRVSHAPPVTWLPFAIKAEVGLYYASDDMQYTGPSVLIYALSLIRRGAASQSSKLAESFLPDVAQWRIERMTIRLIAVSSSN